MSFSKLYFENSTATRFFKASPGGDDDDELDDEDDWDDDEEWEDEDGEGGE